MTIQIIIYIQYLQLSKRLEMNSIPDILDILVFVSRDHERIVCHLCQTQFPSNSNGDG